MLENYNTNKKSPFKVPENYFENFNKEIMAKLPQEKAIPKRVILWQKVASWSAVAAMLSAILLSVSTALNSPNSNASRTKQEVYVNSKTTTISPVDGEDFLNYIEEQSVNAVYNETLLN